MIKQFFKIGGVKNEKEFLAKYPTEESFFRQHPEALGMLEQQMPYMPSYSDMVMPQAMYGMGMAYGGYVPRAANGMQVGNPPRRSDYMDNEEQYQADMDAYLASLQQQTGPLMQPNGMSYMVPPRQQDFADYESYSQAMDEYLSGLQQQANTSQTMPQGSMSGAPVPGPSPYVPTNKFNLKDYSGVSIVDFLSAQGKPADFSSRKQLASALGITNYRGTASQNKQMMQMLKQSPDILTDYQGVAQPTAGVRKRAASGKNASAVPSTEEVANAKQEALAAPTSTSVGTSLRGQTYANNPLMDLINQGGSQVIRRSLADGRWVHVPDPAGMMTAENARRIKLAQDANMREALESSGQPMFRQGYKKGGSWNGTWNGNQGFQVGGSYIPDYASSAYGLPQFELGAPIYADGGMSPEEAMMMQQQGAGAPPMPEQGGGMDQQQVVQAIMQMVQQGMGPDEIMQQLVQGGVPPEMAQQLIQMVMMQVQGGQGGMGGGQPNGVQQPMAPPSPEQGMEGMQMPGGMAKGGMVPGWEGEVTMEQLEDLRRKGIKFDII